MFNGRKIAHNAVAIVQAIDGYQFGVDITQAKDFVYDKMKDQAGGFLGVQMLYVDAAEVFTAAEPDNRETFDWPEAIDTYALALVDTMRRTREWPPESMQKKLAKLCIETYSF